MPKFDINASRYARFFGSRSNQRFLQTFIDTKDLLRTNYGWHLTQGRRAANATPVAPDGTATFTVKERSLEAAPLMDLRAPLGQSNPADLKGIEVYSATIPDFIAKGIVETAIEREYKLKQFEIFGNDADIVIQWAQRVQTLKDSADATLNYLTAQLLSTGKMSYESIGQGIRTEIATIPIPDSNKVKAGTKVWTDADCKILQQMRTIEQHFRDKWNYAGPLVWQMPKKLYTDTFLENEEVKALITEYRKNPLMWHATTDGMSFNQRALDAALNDYDGVSPIQVVEERERNITHATDTFVNGWNANTVVLRPAGDAVEFQYKTCLDQELSGKYGAKAIDKVWATLPGGMATLCNATMDNGQFREWHTDVMLSAVPALLCFQHIVQVNTAEAGTLTA